jgi:hypothetical protein
MYKDEEWLSLYEPFIKLYSKYWGNYIKFAHDNEKSNISLPLLICLSELYLKQQKKLMFIGQETSWWEWSDETIEYNIDSMTGILDRYYEFECGRYKSNQTPLWRTINYIEEKLQIQKGGIIWNNLNKINIAGKRPDSKIENELLSSFPVFKAEMKICKPEIVVFFTGPNYDSLISNIYNGVHFHKVSGNSSRELARLEHTDLPLKAYRTYHPGYLVRTPGTLYRDILNTILQEIQ